MELILPIARIALLAVLAVAGMTKLKDRAGTGRMLNAFGVAAPWSTHLVVALPIAELALAAMLVWPATVWMGALGAFCLLSIFLAGIVYNLAHGRTPACNCFGQISPQPIGTPTVIRNLALLALSLLLIMGGNYPEAVGFERFALLGSQVNWPLALIGLLLATQLYLTLHVIQQQGRILRRLGAIEPPAHPEQGGAATGHGGLPIGTMAPGFALPNLLGEQITLGMLRETGSPILLLFMNPGCGPCLAFTPEVSQWMGASHSNLTIAVISEGLAQENIAKGDAMNARLILLQHEQEIANAYHAWGTPSGVIVDVQGRIASEVAQGADAIRALAARSDSVIRALPPAALPAHASPRPRGVPAADIAVGDPVPSLVFRSIDGHPVELKPEGGRPVALLFWNPHCGFCQRMLDDLRAWDTDPPEGAPALMVVTSGSRDDNLTLGLRSHIVFDSDATAARLFGTGGTPSAVLVDSMGRLASQVAIGAEAVLALVGYRSKAFS